MSGSRDFLAGAGEMATLMRATTGLRRRSVEPEGWPSGPAHGGAPAPQQPFTPCTSSGGRRRRSSTYDAFVPSAGTERHPSVLGRPASETWGEIWR